VPRTRRKAQEHLPRSMRQHSSAYVSIHTTRKAQEHLPRRLSVVRTQKCHGLLGDVSIRQHTSAYVSILRLAVLHTHKCHELLRYILNRQTSAV
jgi:hypothetical protein